VTLGTLAGTTPASTTPCFTLTIRFSSVGAPPFRAVGNRIVRVAGQG
jgi:hypothetical protein